MTDGVAITIEQGVQTIRFERPAKKNALTGEMYEAMSEAETGGASRVAGAMLAPYCEAEGAEPIVQELGVRGLALWRAAVPQITMNGSLVVAAPRDQGELARFARMTEGHRTIDAATVDTLEPDQMKLLAKFFSQQTWPTISHEANPATTRLALDAIETAECIACHLGDFRGNSRVPRLAGQYPEYLNKTMLDFKARVRNNAPDKATLLALYSEEEIKALADYLGSLSVYQRSQNAETQ